MRYRTRFAPSPTGPLHLGHAFSALTAWERAKAAGGDSLLRIEDLDRGRARPEWEAAILRDLAWLGVTWPEPVMRQSTRAAAYDAALRQLWAAGLLYPCICSRRDVAAAAAAPQEGAPLTGPDGIVYPGTCRHVPAGPFPDDGTLRLNMRVALQSIDAVAFLETCDDAGHPCGAQRVPADQLIRGVGDVVLRRKGGEAAYHLAVVVDDAAQDITEVVRGADLFETTAIHALLQGLLGLPVPAYHHHRLIRDAQGKRLAKRDDARALATLRADGWRAEDVRAAVGLSPRAP